MTSSFDDAYEIVRKWEGNWSSHKDDPGGLTRWGITLLGLIDRDYDMNGDGSIDHNDLKDMDEEDAREYYKTYYWDSVELDELPAAHAMVVFDCSVNQGSSRAKRWMQKALGVESDGIIGPVTKAAMRQVKGRAFLVEFCTYRALHYASLSIFVTFGRGWMRRLFDVYGAAVTKLED